MHLREFHRSDLSTISDILAVCNANDPLVRFFSPDNLKYYTTYRYGSWRFLRSKIMVRGMVTMVLETDPEDYSTSQADKAPEVVGWIMYQRVGDSPKAKEWQKINSSWFSSFERSLLSIEDRYHRVFTGVEHTFDHQKFNSIKHILNEKWDKDILGEAWKLDGLMVHPHWQRKGLSKIMVDWGFQRGQEELVPVLVRASPTGNLAYRKAGFKSVGVMGFGEYFDELVNGGEAIQMWVWDPKVEEKDGIEGNWAERARIKREQVLREKKLEKEKAAASKA